MAKTRIPANVLPIIEPVSQFLADQGFTLVQGRYIFEKKSPIGKVKIVFSLLTPFSGLHPFTWCTFVHCEPVVRRLDGLKLYDGRIYRYDEDEVSILASYDIADHFGMKDYDEEHNIVDDRPFMDISNPDHVKQCMEYFKRFVLDLALPHFAALNSVADVAQYYFYYADGRPKIIEEIETNFLQTLTASHMVNHPDLEKRFEIFRDRSVKNNPDMLAGYINLREHLGLPPWA